MPTTGAYASADEFAGDVALIRDSLEQNRGEHAGLFGVERLLRSRETVATKSHASSNSRSHTGGGESLT